MNKKKELITRSYVICSLLGICLLGGAMGTIIYTIMNNYLKIHSVNITICIILFIVFCIYLWLPTMIAEDQFSSIDEKGLKILPKYKTREKFKIVMYVLLNNTIVPFLHTIGLEDIKKCIFTFERHWGNWGYSRYNLKLIIITEHEKRTLFINPMSNGPVYPSGKGFPFAGIKSNFDILNLLSYLQKAGVQVEDPYNIQEALKNPDIVLYDYLESINKRIIF